MIKDFNQAIVELLFQFDCVIVPNFGAFIKREKPASFSKETQSFHPASVELIFNQQLNEDDGLLTKYIQAKFEYSKSEAASELRNFVEELRIHLFNEGAIQFAGLGRMTLNVYDQIVFNGQPEIPLLQKQFGYQPIDLEPILKIEKVISNPRRAKLRYIAAAITIPVIVISSWASLYPEQVKDTYYHYASMVPFNTSESQLNYQSHFEIPSKQVAQEEKDALIEKLIAKLNNDREECLTISVQKTTVVPVEKLEQIQPVNIPIGKNIHIVVGAFASKRNAKKQIRKLKRKGYEGTILKEPSSRLHRVSIEKFATEADAESVLNDFKKKYKGAWILNNN